VKSHHVASRSAVIQRDACQLFDIVRDFERAPRWRSDVQRVDILDPKRFREHSKHGSVTYEVMSEEPGRRLVTRVADTNLGYSGSWTWTFEPVAGGTRVTITEDGEVTNLLFIVVSKILGHTRTIDRTLAALARA
jgi:uncharacterized membrane protein